MANSTQQTNEMEQASSETENNSNINSSKLCNALKYAYVISVFILGFGIVGLKLVVPAFDDWLDVMQQDVLEFFLENSVIYIILVILLVTLGKGFGVKDVLSLRTISVVILGYKIAPNSKFLCFIVSVLILGVLSSISKLLEYRAIGHELQIVQGTPVKYIFKYIRKLLLFCITDEDTIEWVDPKYTFIISETTRNDDNMDVYSNFYAVLSACCTKGNEDVTDVKNQERHDVGSEAEVTQKLRTLQHGLCNVSVFILAVVWTSVVEWVQPIAELFQYAHNWRLSAKNVIIIILSEMVDFDKMVEVILIIDSLYESGDIIAGKIKGILFKPLFWTLGYLVVMPLSLLWAYSFYKKYFNDNIEFAASNSGISVGGGAEMVPPLDRTTTPLLMDTDPDVNEFPDVPNGNKSVDMWKKMKYIHPKDLTKDSKTQQKQSKDINFADCRTNTQDSTHL